MDSIILTIKKEVETPFVLSGSNIDDQVISSTPTSVIGNVNLKGPKGDPSIRGIGSFVAGRPLSSETILGFIAPYNFTIDLDKSAVHATAPADGENIFIVYRKRAGTVIQLGTITFPIAGTEGVIDLLDYDILMGDFITIVSPVAPDGELANLTFLLVS